VHRLRKEEATGGAVDVGEVKTRGCGDIDEEGLFRGDGGLPTGRLLTADSGEPNGEAE